MKNPYQARGTLAGQSYVERDADTELQGAIKDNDRYPFFLAPRQSGKSSVMERARSLLATEDLKIVIIDLSLFSKKELDDLNHFVFNFVTSIYEKLGVTEKLGSNLRDLKYEPFFIFKSITLLLNNLVGRIVVCIDELDVLLTSEFKDDFLSQIRAIFNERASHPLLKRIQFILAAAVSQNSLISDPNRSPFNVGKWIVLHDLDKNRVDRLVAIGNWLDTEDYIDRVSNRILYWTSGSVFLSQSILEKAYYIRYEIAESWDICELIDKIDDIVAGMILSAPHEIHFRNIANQLRKQPLLLSAWKNWIDGIVPDMEVRECLFLAGISDEKNPIRNRIYQRVFSVGGTLCIEPEVDRSDNIEQTIEHCNQALKMYTHHAFSEDWARTQVNLANAYSDRIKGYRAKNIEKAIDHYNQALKVYTRQAFPVDWAMIQNNLANAYSDRIRGDRVENIEKAIGYFNQALEIYTLHDFPVDWARTQIILATAYSNRIRGDVAENIEKAIEHYNKALEVFTYRDFPEDWAATLNNLASAYGNRIGGNRAENIEKAIEHCNQALKVRTHHDFPVQWAMTQNNLASAYSDRIRGDRAENIEKAIEHYNQALEVFTYQVFPVQWAMTQNNLASAYGDRIKGDAAENIEKAIEHFNQALEVYTRQAFPVDWARTQIILATAYSNRIRGDVAENIEKAIEHCNQALEVYTLHDFPVDWARTQNNLASAYSDRIRGDRAENIEKAISLYHNALVIYKLESMPNAFCRTCRFLGNLYLDKGQWKDAVESYKDGIKACNLLYSSGLSTGSKSDEVGENASIYRNASLAACRLGLTTEALLILERGKICLLSEALRLKMRPPEGAPKNEWIKYEQAVEKYRTITKFSGHEEDYIQRGKKVQMALEELDAAVKIVQSYVPGFQKELDIFDILSILDEETALLAFCITNKGSIGLVVSISEGIQSVDIPSFKTEDLNRLLFQFDGQRFINGGWIGDYLSYINDSGTSHHENSFQAWQKTVNEVLSSIGIKLFDPLLAKLPPQIKRLIFLPSGGLFLLPLHAILLSDGQLLLQRYCISYAPSISLLREMKNKAGTVVGKGLYAVINPQEDPSLVFSRWESQTISKLFQSRQVNIGKTGTKPTVLDSVPGRAYLHFSCHGGYNWNDPSQSGLYLYGGRKLSLADLQSDVVDMSSARLVTLSACETGIIDILKGSADEFVGLPAGFMLAGVPCVVSSLWSVPDISTALLMERFYSNHIAGGMDIPQALQDAQLWVRDLKSGQVADYVENCYQSSKWEGKSKGIIEHYRERYLKMAEESPDEKPFQHPYYWAAFTVNGA